MIVYTKCLLLPGNLFPGKPWLFFRPVKILCVFVVIIPEAADPFKVQLLAIIRSPTATF